MVCWVFLFGFVGVYFGYHANVRLRFKLACGLGSPWTRDGGIPQGCPLSMVFIVALYLPGLLLLMTLGLVVFRSLSSLSLLFTPPVAGLRGSGDTPSFRNFRSVPKSRRLHRSS